MQGFKRNDASLIVDEVDAYPKGERADPVTGKVRIDPAELQSLREARNALDAVASMARTVFNRGNLNTAADVPMIALSAKILAEADKAKRAE